MVSQDTVYGTPQTDKLSLFGKPYACPPYLPLHLSLNGPLSWRWLPWGLKLRLDLLSGFLGFSLLFTGLPLILYGSLSDGSGVVSIIVGLFLVSVGGGALFFGYINWWNAHVRAAVAVTRGKASQAAEMWARCTSPWLAKDPFHTVVVGLGGPTFVVLRDGSTEVVCPYLGGEPWIEGLSLNDAVEPEVRPEAHGAVPPPPPVPQPVRPPGWGSGGGGGGGGAQPAPAYYWRPAHSVQPPPPGGGGVGGGWGGGGAAAAAAATPPGAPPAPGHHPHYGQPVPASRSAPASPPEAGAAGGGVPQAGPPPAAASPAPPVAAAGAGEP